MAWHTLPFILLVVCFYATAQGTDEGGNNTATTSSSVTTEQSTLKAVSPTTQNAEIYSSIPDTFYYNCTEDGGIEIVNQNISLNNVRIVNSSANDCASPEILPGSQNIFIANCMMNSTVDIALELANETDIVGGSHFKTFRITCDDVNIMPYYLNVTADETFKDKPSPHVITRPTPPPIKKLQMEIESQSGPVTEATIGQQLTIVINVTDEDKVQIKPTECEATGNGHSVILWQEKGCYHNTELFGGKWTNSTDKSVTNTMYGFRFVGASNSISIRCNVRVCPEGYRGDACHLDCKKRKHKRVHRLPIGVTTKMLTTSLSIKDSVLTTSGSGRLESKLSRIIGLSAIVFVFVKSNFFRG